jgi:4-amino-4-deoxy-L-arabinose transferase-like glycosyltransferase
VIERARRVWAWAQRHPLLVVAVVASIGAVGSMWSIWHERLPGNLDPDEAGYVAAALRYQRSIDPAHPGVVVQEVAQSVTGPLVPVLSVVPLVLGPRDLRSAMLVQPVLGVVLAVSATAITRRLAGPGWAILAGAYVAALPRVVEATETYWLGLGAAAMLAVALALLLRPDGLEGRARFGLGAALGATLLARTMAVSLVPGVIVAMVVMAWGERRRLVGAAQALAVAVAVAGPWFLVRRREVFGYLFSYGYGANAGEFGSGGVATRARVRVRELVEYTVRWPYRFWPWQLGWAILAAVVGYAVVRFAPRGRPDRWSHGQRCAVALVAVLVPGLAALVTTTNVGIWFDLPLYVPLVALVVAAVSRLPRWPRLLPAGVLVAVAVIGPLAVRAQDTDRMDLGHREYDARFDDLHGASGRAAAHEWAGLNRKVAAALEPLAGNRTRDHVLMTGNMFTVNANSVTLASELRGVGLIIGVPDTMGDAWRAELGHRWNRALVVVRYPRRTFLPDRGWAKVEAAARSAGWTQVASWTMPSDRGGDVVLLVPPR